VPDIAREEQVNSCYVYTLLRLPWLAPDITTRDRHGRQPPQLNICRPTGPISACCLDSDENRVHDSQAVFLGQLQTFGN